MEEHGNAAKPSAGPSLPSSIEEPFGIEPPPPQPKKALSQLVAKLPGPDDLPITDGPPAQVEPEGDQPGGPHPDEVADILGPPAGDPDHGRRGD